MFYILFRKIFCLVSLIITKCLSSYPCISLLSSNDERFRTIISFLPTYGQTNILASDTCYIVGMLIGMNKSLNNAREPIQKLLEIKQYVSHFGY